MRITKKMQELEKRDDVEWEEWKDLSPEERATAGAVGGIGQPPEELDEDDNDA